MLGAMEYHCMEDYEPIYFPAALPDSCEFRGQCMHKAPPDFPDWRVLTPHRHERQCYLLLLLVIVVCYPPHWGDLHCWSAPSLCTSPGFVGPLPWACNWAFIPCPPRRPLPLPPSLLMWLLFLSTFVIFSEPPLATFLWPSAPRRLPATPLPPICHLVFYLRAQRREVGTPLAPELVAMASCPPAGASLGLCSKRWLADSPSCMVGGSPILSVSSSYQLPSGWVSTLSAVDLAGYVPPLSYPRLSIYLRVNRYETSTEPCVSLHLPVISGCGLYIRADFLRHFWSGVEVSVRPWKTCTPQRDKFYSWF